ncbi:helix-turn-helix domain-containing protein [Adhaeretor mobilis]|uniref:Helix-turn-helix domain protein n=1 Tax=Adhaeretor mobilis TaxID=1930276 RepID=A0A517N2A0_9BACT|nr:helix-turn-helix transcriptional regulator [Adhaeretor mobilis]QDT01264.1 Helix-turn-helix domain protein [Adhaeretor mobilis]
MAIPAHSSPPPAIYDSPRGTLDSPRGTLYGANVRRLMARFNMTLAEVVEATGLDERTLRSILREKTRPHARTLHKLATGLGVTTDELFREPSRAAQQSIQKGQLQRAAFNRATNPTAVATVERHPEIFADWNEQDLAELCSHRGVGGELTEAGTLATAQAMNERRELLNRAALLLETDQADLLREFIAMLYKRASVES